MPTSVCVHYADVLSAYWPCEEAVSAWLHLEASHLPSCYPRVHLSVHSCPAHRCPSKQTAVEEMATKTSSSILNDHPKGWQITSDPSIKLLPLSICPLFFISLDFFKLLPSLDHSVYHSVFTKIKHKVFLQWVSVTHTRPEEWGRRCWEMLKVTLSSNLYSLPSTLLFLRVKLPLIAPL